MSLLRFAVAGGVMLASASSIWGEATSGKPTLKLKVSTHNGFVPFTLTLTGEVTGVASAESRFCYVNVERTITGPDGKPLDATDKFPCFAASSSDRELHSFKKELTLDEAGTYRYRIVIPREKGKRFYSVSQEVRAIAEPRSLRNIEDRSRPDG